MKQWRSLDFNSSHMAAGAVRDGERLSSMSSIMLLRCIVALTCIFNTETELRLILNTYINCFTNVHTVVAVADIAAASKCVRKHGHLNFSHKISSRSIFSRWPTPKTVINSSFFPNTYTNVGISTKIEFLYHLACEILSKKALRWCPIFGIQDGDHNVSTSNGNIVFLFQEGLSFPKMHMVTNLQTNWTEIHNNPDYRARGDPSSFQPYTSSLA